MMATVEERVKEFIEIWEKRESGELPPIDMRISCQSCGVQVMGDDTVSFTTRDLICKGCLDKGEHGTGKNNLK
jgi:hypothetical protein